MAYVVKKAIKKYIPKSSSLRNVLTLVSGTALAQAIPLLISPILSRIYSPTEFGVFTLFLSISQILASLANGRYELAIVLPKKEKQAVNVLLLCLIITISVSFLSFVIIWIGYDYFSSLINEKFHSPWLFLISLSILASGTFNAFNYYHTRKSSYPLISKSTISKGGTNGIAQVALGGAGAINGLIVGQVLSQFLGNILFIINFVSTRMYRLFNWKEVKNQATIHSDFPKFSVWGIFLNTFSQNFVNFFISSLYSTTTLGYYSYGFRYLSLPAGLIGNSFGQVYMQEISEARQKDGRADKEFVSTLKKLLFLSLPAFIIGFFFIEEVFVFVFGEEWREAGYYAQIMSPLILVRFIAAPLSITTNVFEKQKLSLLIHLLLFFLIGIVALITFYTELTVSGFLIIQTVVLSIFYLLVILMNYLISKGKK